MIGRYTLSWLPAALSLLVVSCATADEAAKVTPVAPPIDFARDIQPILARRCFACHGPDKAEGGLRLHQADTALLELDSGEHAIVPGEPKKSEMLVRVSSADDSIRMPPEGKALTELEIEKLTRWISAGAKWESHWAYDAPRVEAIPQVKDQAWVRNPIDAFVLSKIEARGLKPAPPAAKGALLRRLYYDLTGLPPTPEEVAAFLADESPEAYEKVVDHLLDSPRYGERWARHWLDVVRFAETNSFERDGVKPHAWRFRDYVIRSFNDDKPYDQFIREQLAGDEMENPSADAIIATGFYRLGLWDDEPADRELAKFDAYDDLVTTVSQGFLGLTVNCARCHDHKIDPIRQKDYYAMVSFFRGVTSMSNGGPQIERALHDGEAGKKAYDEALADLRRRKDETQMKISTIEKEFRTQLAAANTEAERPSDLEELQYRFYRDSWQKLPDFDNLKAETIDKVPSQRFDIGLATREDFFGFVFTGVLKVPADGEYTFKLDGDDGVRLLLDGKKIAERDGIHGLGDVQTAKLALKAGRVPIRLEYFQGAFGKDLVVTWTGPDGKEHYLSANEDEGEGKRPNRRRDFNQLINERGEKVLGNVLWAEYKEAKETLNRLNNEKPPVEMALCVTEAGQQAPETFILNRGSPAAPGEKVEPAFVQILGGGAAKYEPVPSANSSGRRTALANWIASPDNRLTSRVMVNRIWQHHFGRGIVRSPNNFGLLGDMPTHRELLDYLALEFVKQGWHLKPMHKLMVMSNTYRQSSQGSPEAIATDPGNDLFAHFNMRRVSAEELRDSIFAVNGRLNLKMYGPGFYPEISKEVLAGQSVPGAGWGKTSTAEQARRSVYIHVKRSLITPLLSAFDFPDTDGTCEARFHTTQPGQALAMLNGDFLNEEAAALAKRLAAEAGDDVRAQVALALKIALCREPKPAEIQRGLELIKALQEKHGQSAATAMNHYCLYVLNLNEFVYLD